MMEDTKTENGDDPAFACCDSGQDYLQDGLTKREYASIMAMQGYLSGPWDKCQYSELAKMSVNQADALLKALEQ